MNQVSHFSLLLFPQLRRHTREAFLGLRDMGGDRHNRSFRLGQRHIGEAFSLEIMGGYYLLFVFSDIPALMSISLSCDTLPFTNGCPFAFNHGPCGASQCEELRLVLAARAVAGLHPFLLNKRSSSSGRGSNWRFVIGSDSVIAGCLCA